MADPFYVLYTLRGRRAMPAWEKPHVLRGAEIFWKHRPHRLDGNIPATYLCPARILCVASGAKASVIPHVLSFVLEILLFQIENEGCVSNPRIYIQTPTHSSQNKVQRFFLWWKWRELNSRPKRYSRGFLRAKIFNKLHLPTPEDQR